MTRTFRRIVVVGGGLAGARSAEALRHLGFDGSLILLSGEPDGPYDRPALSKEVLTGKRDPARLDLGDANHYAKLGVELRAGVRATGLDLDRKRVRADGTDIPFDGLILATGSEARKLPDGVVADQSRIHTLRSRDDAVALRDALTRASRLVVIGAGFIGSEVASSARSKGLEVTVLESASVPLARVVGSQIGEVCADLQRRHGVRLLTDAHVTAVEEQSGEFGVSLADGRVVRGDVVVAGVGGVPMVSWLSGSGLALNDGVLCDPYLATSHPDIYAAGDIVRWHNGLFSASMRSEQWTNAVEQARCAARNLLADAEDRVPYRGSNYFWSDQYGVRIQAAGVTAADEVRVVQGDVDSFRFTALYRKGDRLVGAFSMSQAAAFVRSKQLIERRERWSSAMAFTDSGGLAA